MSIGVDPFSNDRNVAEPRLFRDPRIRALPPFSDHGHLHVPSPDGLLRDRRCSPPRDDEEDGVSQRAYEPSRGTRSQAEAEPPPWCERRGDERDERAPARRARGQAGHECDVRRDEQREGSDEPQGDDLVA